MTLPVPSGWREVELRDVVTELNAGVSVNSEDRPIGRGEVGVLKTSCVTSGRFKPTQHKAVIEKDVGRVATPVVRDHIIMSRMNTAALVGASGYVERDAPDLYLPDRLWQFGTRPGIADARWLAYVLGSREVRRVLSSVASGTSGSMKNLSKDQVRSLRVLVPPVQEQRDIAAALKAADEAIAAGEAVAEQIDDVRRRLALDLVTRGLGHHHGEHIAAGPVTCPSRWQVMRIERAVSSCDYGLSCAMSLDATGVACLRMGNIQSGDVVLDDLKYVAPDDATNDLLLSPGDVLFNRTNSKDLVGKVGLFRGSGRPVTFASYLLRLRANPAIVVGEWLATVLNLDPYQRLIRSVATPGSSQVNVNRTRLLAIEVPVPPLNEQRAIVAALGAISERAEKDCAALVQRRLVKAALADALLSGRLRVRAAA